MVWRGAAACSRFAHSVESADAVPSLEVEHVLTWMGGGAFVGGNPMEGLWSSPGNLGRGLIISRVGD